MDDSSGFSSNVNIGNMNGYGKASAEDGLYTNAQREAASSPQYSMPGILNYLQTEWSKMEMQRSQWDIEKAELQARIAFLQGERSGQEMLKQDLVRRIKMLEYALKQERVKYHQLKGDMNAAAIVAAVVSSSASPTNGGVTQTTNAAATSSTDTTGGGRSSGDQIGSSKSEDAATGKSLDPAEKLAVDTQRAVVANAKWRESRHRLRQFLQEVGYTDTILDARQARVKQLMEGVFPGGASSRVLTGSISEAMTFSGGLVGGMSGSVIKCPSEGSSGTVGQSGGALSLAEHRTGSGGRMNGDGKLMSSGGGGVGSLMDGAGGPETDALANFDFLGGEENEELDMEGSEEGQRKSGGGGKDGNSFIDSLGGDLSSPKPIRFGRKGGKHSSLKAMLASLEEDCRDLSSLEMHQGSEEGNDLDSTAGGSGGGPHPPGYTTGGGGGGGGVVGGQSPDELEGFTGALGLGDLATLTVANEAEASSRTGPGDLLDGSGGGLMDGSDCNLDTEDGMGEGCGEVASGVVGPGERKSWTPKYTLRGHFDSIRSVVFHPSERALFTGSEDGTINVWNLNKAAQTKKCVSVDVEPIHTLRGHDGPVLGLVMGPQEDGDTLYSAGLDGTIRQWQIPDIRYSDPYDAYDSIENGPLFSGHTDAVWSLARHPTDTTLISTSADGTIRIWQTAGRSPDSSPASASPLLSTITLASLLGEEEMPASLRPTCAQFCPADSGHCAIGCTDGRVMVVDIEMGKIVSQDFNSTGSEGGNRQANCLVCHPALPLIISGHEDCMVRYFDVQEGRTVHSMVAHLDPVTDLALDNYGLYLASASHDSSIRLWNIDNKTCVQENTSHRKKFDEAVLCVAFHPKMPFMASAGADALAKVYI